ncbi:MAG: hypothetical protein F6K08_09840 [Okeania sp. SIO1H6]|nr:hypothetical protein [Okeania sp. SIO1H6]
MSIDRDLNASINLRDAVGLTVNACGGPAADSSGGSKGRCMQRPYTLKYHAM